MIVLGLIFLQLLTTTTAGSPNCTSTCGNISIQYPFGVGPGCFRTGFELICDQSYNPPKLFLGNTTTTVEVLDISIPNGTVTIGANVSGTTEANYTYPNINLTASGPYTVSTAHNKLVAIGCGILAELVSSQVSHQQYVSVCASVCVNQETLPTDGSCTGIGCCQTSIPISLKSFGLQLKSLDQTSSWAAGFPNKAFLVEQSWFTANASDLQKSFSSGTQNQSMIIPAMLDWSIGNSSCDVSMKNNTEYACKSVNSLCSNSSSGTGYRCNCLSGYQGNPYKEDGCQDINECELTGMCHGSNNCTNTPGSYICSCYQGKSGDPKTEACVASSKGLIPPSGVLVIVGVGIFVCLLSLPIAVAMMTYKLKARRTKKLKEKFFKQNRGYLLQQLISSSKDIAERMKIFSLDELEKATNNFNPTRILGRGGHGTVYKGILCDQRVVAIKKSKIKMQREIDEFINEVVILSQINHRNVVKLYGCCLETEVPLLVYEFISNGALSDHLHADPQCPLSWENRLRIASETARALAYLHTSASISIFHRDIKSANILLDDSLTAKLSDFGASRSIPVNQTGITTAVQGTYGYLDPEYYYTGRLTEKSDVYGFGVILVEMLTRETPVCNGRFPEGGNLAANFMIVMKENRLFDILDPQVVHEGRKKEIKAVAAIAESCLRLRGEERPTMKQVEMRLEALKGGSSKKRQVHPWREKRLEEGERMLHTLSIEGSSSSTEFMTRQFSLEEEFWMSTGFPR